MIAKKRAKSNFKFRSLVNYLIYTIANGFFRETKAQVIQFLVEALKIKGKELDLGYGSENRNKALKMILLELFVSDYSLQNSILVISLGCKAGIQKLIK